ncbi:alpha-N-arabinofuranosidase [Novosphingobium mangrovi (ex Huang et al. 2023)]|uniref:non-reducing end alpha-L-arabinofuranosidase n=1 Tax=Novosphingobium mangrovi (ex Huang et al. 2023) TaxID=2976432 RepID=A0ABT2I9K2_9SPHN|nr:alpha-L-arabinofuranosidase C-terminal domain-containing protein [Novosphingobium mangrovi (ex Huang et al. 2023)]MCT2401187.1 alpha-N-arabinofuranosidase [Novosphingobium mangrovi (ex Huang et al. 2023)]
MIKTLQYTAVAALLGATALAGIGATAAHADTNGQPTTAEIHADTPGPVYDKRIFTQFAEHLGNGIYGGLWVGQDSPIPNTNGFRNDVVSALRALSVPVIRWPGGCFADEYHWREGIGPQNQRPVKVNTHWGGVTEPNTVGTHEYFELLRQVGAEAYISGNVGDGSPREMAEWVEYMTAPAGTLADERAKNGHKEPWKVPAFGIGNELWGCGGNMRPEYAADVTRRYATFVKAPAGTRILKIASGANVDDYNWTETMMKVAGPLLDGLSLHYYTLPEGGWPPKADPVNFDETAWADTLHETWRMDELITKHSAIMDKYDPDKRVFLAVDEWGAWYAQDPGTHPGFLRQQNTLRDALIAAINLDIFARHADRVKMTAIAQMVNVLQAMILTDGSEMVLTPTYYVFDMYKPWQDATVLPIDIATPTYTKGKFTVPAVSGSAVMAKNGKIHVGLSNADPEKPNTVTISLDGVKASGVTGTILTAPAINSHNTFDKPGVVKPAAFSGARVKGGKLVVTLPAKSIVTLELR